jgi:hypothetical protein
MPATDASERPLNDVLVLEIEIVCRHGPTTGVW